jgi:flavodoxin I
MSYKIAPVYTSKTGNTKELIQLLFEIFQAYDIEVSVFQIEEFPFDDLTRFEAIIIGTYTWGNGDIPDEMVPLYRAFETQYVKNIVTGVVGTGDQFYPNFCAAVDEFRDMLYVHTQLSVTLKIELLPQLKDLDRCRKFVELLLKSLEEKRVDCNDK